MALQKFTIVLPAASAPPPAPAPSPPPPAPAPSPKPTKPPKPPRKTDQLTGWFKMHDTSTRTGWYNVKNLAPPPDGGMPWPERMWFDAENYRWRPKPFDILVYHPSGRYFKNARWQGRLNHD